MTVSSETVRDDCIDVPLTIRVQVLLTVHDIFTDCRVIVRSIVLRPNCLEARNQRVFAVIVIAHPYIKQDRMELEI